MGLNILLTGNCDKRDGTGKFVRRHQPWTPERWDDCYFDRKGRARVYRPDYPRAWFYKTSKGYAFRAHVVWWLMTGKVVSPDTELDHINGDFTDDRFENLGPLSRSDHRTKHQGASVLCKCRTCCKNFVTLKCKIEAGRGKYCSPFCYQHRKDPLIQGLYA